MTCAERDVRRGAFEAVNDKVVGDGRRMVRCVGGLSILNVRSSFVRVPGGSP